MSTSDSGCCYAQGPTSDPSVSPPVSTGNTNHMVTRSKAGIFKPKVLTAEIHDYEPRTVDEALAD